MTVKWQSFKNSGKWYSEGIGELPIYYEDTRKVLECLEINSGMAPGYMKSRQHSIVIYDGDGDFFPLMIPSLPF